MKCQSLFSRTIRTVIQKSSAVIFAQHAKLLKKKKGHPLKGAIQKLLPVLHDMLNKAINKQDMVGAY